MLFLLFQLGEDRYALEIGQIVEVLPMVSMKAIPQAAPGVAGIFNYRGTPVPVIDLAELALGAPSRPRISTRIILVQYVEAGEPRYDVQRQRSLPSDQWRGGNPGPGPGGPAHLLGLLAEMTTETLRRQEAEFVDAGVTVEAAPYLGPVTKDGRGIIQRVEVTRLLSADVRDQLFRQPLEHV